MELENNYELLQKNTISILRNYPRFLTLLYAIARRLDNLQECADFLSEALCIEKAEDIWLDYIAWLVGATRDYFGADKFFSVNLRHVNVEKYFWFRGQTISQNSKIKDILFRRRIYAKIGFNTTKSTREENIFIIKNMTFADHVIIENIEPMVLDVTLYGDNIIDSATLRDDINSILSNGVGVRNLVIRGLDEWQ